VNEIETEDVLGVLRSLWLKRPATASRLPTVPLSSRAFVLNGETTTWRSRLRNAIIADQPT
jgi:hypothetical protein